MPEIGRFIQEDPHPGFQSHPSSVVNKYTYAANNPVRYRDPSGKILPIFVAKAYGAAIGAITAGSIALLSGQDIGSAFQAAVGGAIGGGLAAGAMFLGAQYLGPYVGQLAGKVIGGAIFGGLYSGLSKYIDYLLKVE